MWRAKKPCTSSAVVTRCSGCRQESAVGNGLFASGPAGTVSNLPARVQWAHHNPFAGVVPAAARVLCPGGHYESAARRAHEPAVTGAGAGALYRGHLDLVWLRIASCAGCVQAGQCLRRLPAVRRRHAVRCAQVGSVETRELEPAFRNLSVDGRPLTTLFYNKGL